jgi:hypothetical protein
LEPGTCFRYSLFFGGGEAAAEKRAQTRRSIRASYEQEFLEKFNLKN